MPMKVNGVENVKDITYGPLCFKRGDSYLAFIAQPVWDMEDFDKRCPYPENTHVYYNSDGKKVKDFECSAWRETEAEYWRQRWGYIVLKSLEPSNLEIDGISLNDPKTWGSVEDALYQELNPQEFKRLMNMVDEANALDEAKLEANKSDFILRQTDANTLPVSSSDSASANDSE